MPRERSAAIAIDCDRFPEIAAGRRQTAAMNVAATSDGIGKRQIQQHLI